MSNFKSCWRSLLLTASFLIAGCTQFTSLKNPIDPETPNWNGRISVQVQKPTPQTLVASFELAGSAQAGQLRLNTPMGTTVAALSWSPLQVLLDTGSHTRYFSSVEALMEEVVGAEVPLSALFDWLNGNATQPAGWQVDLSHYAAGKISATRVTPLPVVQLHMLFE